MQFGYGYFFPDQKITFGSRKQDYVDKIGDPDSIFEKIRFALRNLPREFLPRGFDLSTDAPYLRIMNRQNGSIMTGEAGDNMGRGGRSTLYFLDEAAFFEHPQKVEAAISENSDCKIYISTPNGVGNIFHQKRFGGKVPVFTFHWFDDPRKDKAWYDKKKATLDSVIFAQEIEIDYGASLENVCIPALWVKAALNFNPSGIDTGELMAGLDVADEGGDLNAFCVRQGSQVQGQTKTWAEGNTTQTARKAKNYCLDLGIPTLCYDSIGVGAGVKGELAELEKELSEYQIPNTKGRTWPFKAVGINVGIAPTKGHYVENKKNADTFLNLKAQLWWLMRRRFEKTYEHVSGVKTYSLDELISIPNDNDLIVELSQPRFFFSNNGKIQIESKKSMRERGLKIPNKADALMLAFAPYRDLTRDPKIRIL